MTLTTLLRRAERALAKSEAAADLQRAADRNVRREAARIALAALARRGIEPRRCVISFSDPTYARWHPDPMRFDGIEAYRSKRFTDDSPCWRIKVTCTGFRKDGRPRKDWSTATFDLDHPRDIISHVRLVKDTTP